MRAIEEQDSMLDLYRQLSVANSSFDLGRNRPQTPSPCWRVWLAGG
jgi:hypothetical protein